MKLMAAFLEKFDYDTYLAVVAGVIKVAFATAWCAHHFFGWTAR